MHPLFKNLTTAFLIGFLDIPIAYSQTQEQIIMFCVTNATVVGHMADLRDKGTTKKQVEQMVQGEIVKEQQDEIDRVFKEKKKSPQKLAEDYFGRCLEILGVGKNL